MSEWISVEVALPVHGDDVDVWCDGCRVTDVEFENGKFKNWFNEGCGGVISCCEEIYPTHWMPLPEPPK